METELYKNLERKELFLPLLKKFMRRSIQEQYDSEKSQPSEITYGMFYERFLDTVVDINVENVFQYCQSPIERIFLNSLQLLFVRNKMPCLFITAPFQNAEKEISDLRSHYKLVEDYILAYKEQTGDDQLTNFEGKLKEMESKGKIPMEMVEDVLMYNYLRKPFEWNSYHITPQAGFPSLKVAKRGIRVDLFIWVPADPTFKLIVECDGFAYHNTKESFQNDRIRDRMLQQNGYRVIRYSGAEINKAPEVASSNLFDMLIALDKNWEGSRVV